MGLYDLIVMVIAAVVAKVHEFLSTINSCNVSFTDATNGFLNFVIVLVSNHKGNLVFDLILRMLIEQKVEMIGLGLLLRWNEQGINLAAGFIELPDLSEDYLAHQKIEDFVGLLVIFLEIEVPAEEQDILKRNHLIYYLLFVFSLVISYIYQGIQFFLLL